MLDRSRRILLAGALLLSQAVAAQSEPTDWPFSNPRVLPAPPTAGVPLEVEFDRFGCGGWFPPTVTRQGQLIEMTQFVFDLCLPGQAIAATQRYPIGALEPGSYTLTWQPFNNFVPLGTYTATTQFTVGGSNAPVAVPVTSKPSLIVLALGLLVAALCSRASDWLRSVGHRFAGRTPR